MLPQEESLDVLTEFLLQFGLSQSERYSNRCHSKISSHRLITENVFIYEKKFYRQVLGGTMGSAFTLTLANIFMWKWEKEFVRRQEASNEIYGR
jgi:hypothetical protein